MGDTDGQDFSQQPFVCGGCGRRFDGDGNCTACSDPLLDLRKDDVRHMLHEDDQRRVSDRYRKLLILAIPLGVAAVVLLSLTPVLLVFRVLPFGLGFVAGAGVIAFGINAALMKIFPPERRFPSLH